MQKILYSRLEAAKILGLSIASVESLCRSGQLASIRVGRNHKISADALIEFTKTGTGNRTVTGKELDPLWKGKR